MINTKAKDVPVGSTILYGKEHHVIEKTVLENLTVLNRFTFEHDDLIEVIGFDDPKDETIAKLRDQIAALKAACIAERAENVVKGRAILEKRSLQWACWMTRDLEEAKKQLARELPEIDWED